MIKNWSIKITICSVSGVGHMRWLMSLKISLPSLHSKNKLKPTPSISINLSNFKLSNPTVPN